jgi:quinolinate synthase
MLRLQQPLPDAYTLAAPAELEARIAAAKVELADRLLILGHHYQRDEVIRWADSRGDSLKLARYAAENAQATDIVFCGVHFMAESADVLTAADQRVVLPDLNAGCSMADMADADEVEECWDALAGVIDVERVVPITYVNSSAAVKAFVGRHGGACCTSSNASGVLTWALERGDRVLFVPDQHLGRNTALALGYPAAEMRVWNPRLEQGGLEDRDIKDARFLLWKGHCSVHQRFTPAHVATARADHPGVQVVVHPECSQDVVALADKVGSTERILAWVDEAPAGSALAIGTEIHMVRRMAADHPDKTVFSLDPLICPCSTMFRIDEPHLAWVLDSLVRGEIVNQITVDEETAAGARLALERMLAIA